MPNILESGKNRYIPTLLLSFHKNTLKNGQIAVFSNPSGNAEALNVIVWHITELNTYG